MANGKRAVWVSFGGSMAVVFGLATGQLSPELAPQGKALEKVVATVDYEKVVKSIPSAKARLDDLDKQARALQAEMDALRTQFNDAQNKFKNLVNGTPKWFAKREEVLMLKGQLEIKAKSAEQRMQMEGDKHRIAIYAEIDKKVAEVATKLGIKLVLRNQDIPGNAKPSEILRLHQIRSVVYHHESLDLTDKLIKLMQ